MARLNSFYLSPDEWDRMQGGAWELSGPEARHLSQVLRTPTGARVRLFDGQGREGFFTVASVDRRSAGLEPQELPPVQPRPAGPILALAWNRASGKGVRGRRTMLLEKATELGAAGVVMFQAERSQGNAPDEPKPTWRETCIAAAKQCGALWLPELSVSPGVDGLLTRFGSAAPKVLLWEDARQETMLTARDLPGNPLLIIGPEGGLTPDEARKFQEAGFITRSLGPSVLRWETAALYVLFLAHNAQQARPC